MIKNLLSFFKKQSGGKGYYLPANTLYDATSDATDNLTGVMNIDILEDDTTFTTLEDNEGDLIVDMNLTGNALPSRITNFTSEKTFMKIQADKRLWLNRYV